MVSHIYKELMDIGSVLVPARSNGRAWFIRIPLTKMPVAVLAQTDIFFSSISCLVAATERALRYKLSPVMWTVCNA